MAFHILQLKHIALFTMMSSPNTPFGVMQNAPLAFLLQMQISCPVEGLKLRTQILEHP